MIEEKTGIFPEGIIGIFDAKDVKFSSMITDSKVRAVMKKNQEIGEKNFYHL